MIDNEMISYKVLGICFSLALTITSVGLLVTGYYCYYGKNTLPNNNARCEDIYISGILMTFLIGCALVIWLLVTIVERCEISEPVIPVAHVIKRKNPVRRRSIASSEV